MRSVTDQLSSQPVSDQHHLPPGPAWPNLLFGPSSTCSFISFRPVASSPFAHHDEPRVDMHPQKRTMASIRHTTGKEHEYEDRIHDRKAYSQPATKYNLPLIAPTIMRSVTDQLSSQPVSDLLRWRTAKVHGPIFGASSHDDSFQHWQGA